MRKIFTTLSLFYVFGAFQLSAQVSADFSASALFGCPPLSVSFQDASTGNPSTYDWVFDNGNTSSLANPATTFTQPGIYNVRLIVSDVNSADTQYLQIRVFQPPTPDFISGNNVGCINPCYTVNFTNLTIPGEAPLVESVWDFGNGALPLSSFNAQHCYSLPGIFGITLVVRDSNGCQVNKVIPDYVKIGQKPTSNASATPAQSCSSPQSIQFAGTGVSSNGTLSYRWYFGNGGTSFQQNPTHLMQTGIYDPILIVTDTLGCQDTAFTHVEITNVQAGFSVPSVNACRGIPVQFTDTSNFASSWLWDFGDGTTSTQQHPAHIYNANGSYTVTLTATYGNCSSTAARTAYINVSVPLNFTMSADDTSSCAPPITVNFTSNAPGATAYSWSFGDGAIATVPNPTHTYVTTGTFTVTLGVANSSGCVNTQTLSNPISVGVLNADFSVDSNNGCSPFTVTFANQSSSNVPITNYQWNFGDGNFSTQQNPTHTYLNPGAYIPYLIVVNSEGCRDTVFSTDTIFVGRTLSPQFIADPLVQCINQNVFFINQTIGTSALTSYLWEFGDGQTSTGMNPVHQYSDTGTYDITLTVINEGCPNSIVRLQYVLIVVPRADFYFEFDCTNPTTVAFRDSSQGADTWLWDFGDGTTSTQQHPTHTYASQDDYTVTLTVFNAGTGCTDVMTKQIVIGTPMAGFAADTLSGCFPLQVTFSDTSVFASSWFWDFGDGTTSALRNPQHIYTDTGQYTVSLIINPGAACSDSVVKPAYITAYGVKTQIIATPTTGCVPLAVAFEGSSTSFMGSVVSWAWNFRTGDNSTDANPTYTFNNTGNFNTLLNVTDSYGCTASDVQMIRPRSLVARFRADTIACPRQSIRFTNQSTNANSYTWYFGDGISSTATSPNHVYTSSGIYTITLIARSSSLGCSDTIVKPNFINVSQPIADFYPESDFQACPPFPVQFRNTTNRGGLQWLWYFGDGDTSTSFDPLHVYKYPGNYDVMLIAKNASGCVDTILYPELIRIRGPRGVFTSGPDTGCVPLTVTTTATVFSTVSSQAGFGGGVVYNDSLNVTHTYTAPGTYLIEYILTDSLGCSVGYPVDTILVGNVPHPNLNDTTVCIGNYVQFNLPQGNGYMWSSNMNPDFLNCHDCRNPLSTARDTIAYYVTATSPLGCSATDTVMVYVDALPQIFPGLNFRVCPGDTLQLNAGANVSEVTWSPFLYMDDSTRLNPRVWPPDSMVYRVTAENETGCTITRSVRVQVITHVVANVSLDTTICVGTPVSFNLDVLQASVNDTSFMWMPPQFLQTPYDEDPVFNAPPGDYTYTVIVSSTTCVPDTGTVHVQVVGTPRIEAGDNQTVGTGSNVQLWASASGNVTYQWIPTADSLSCTDCRRPTLTATQNQTIPVVVTNSTGCIDTAYVEVKVEDCNEKMIFVPNTFTPNNDGLNDRLYVRGIVLASVEYFRVLDRWGKLVYESKDVSEGWDGYYPNGRRADVATYVYVLKGVCSGGANISKSGNVTLVR